MQTVTIDCTAITDRASFHRIFAQKLQLADWYGENLDALYDCLTMISVPTVILLLNMQELLNNLGGYGRAAVNMMEQAERENGDFLTIQML